MSILKEMYVDRLHVRVFETRAEMGGAAGTEAAACIKDYLAQKEYVNILFAAAPSQNEVLAALCADTGIDWPRVNAFHMDEYLGLDPAHPSGFRNFLRRAIFDKFSFHSVHLLDGNAPDPEKEAERYSELLKQNPLDICLMGIGENGHIAFNDPPVADFHDKTFAKVVLLEEKCRVQQVNDGCFATVEDVPTHALTITIPGICAAKHLFCSVPGRTKAQAIRHLVQDAVSTDCPATILRLHDDARLYTDADAAAFIL